MKWFVWMFAACSSSAPAAMPDATVDAGPDAWRPSITATPSDGAYPLIVRLSSDTSLNWSIEGQTYSGTHVRHVFCAPGTYTVTAGGASATITVRDGVPA